MQLLNTQVQGNKLKKDYRQLLEFIHWGHCKFNTEGPYMAWLELYFEYKHKKAWRKKKENDLARSRNQNSS